MSKGMTAVALFLSLNSFAMAEGIPEPGVVLYGEVRNTEGGQNVRLTTGTLVWTFRPASGGASVVLTTQLTNLLDQFSYLLIVPAETEIGSLLASSNVLKLTTPAITYTRTNVTLDGQPIFLRTAAQGSLIFGNNSRGLVERVDLTLQRDDLDSDGDGLPDWWENQHFAGNGDPNADSDGDGMKNLNEYVAGTTPTDPNSLFEFIKAERLSDSQMRIQWSSVASKSYTLLRSATLTSDRAQFSVIRTDIAATPPMNTLIDVFTPSPTTYFYLLKVQ
jgi:hypothetical protein